MAVLVDVSYNYLFAVTVTRAPKGKQTENVLSSDSIRRITKEFISWKCFITTEVMHQTAPGNHLSWKLAMPTNIRCAETMAY